MLSPSRGLFSRLRRHLDRLRYHFHEVTHDNVWIPSVDVYGLEEETLVDFELAGVDAEDVEISVENGTLSVSGARRTQWLKHGDVRYHLTERPSNSFFRSIVLPQRVDIERITAHFWNGVLRVHIPNNAAQPTRAHNASMGGSPWRRTIKLDRDRTGSRRSRRSSF